MANVTYDDRSLLVDGQRIWLVSGSVHYFRLPSALWEDRLLKAKRGGLNCISTCLAWNYHEPVEGQWETTGDQDPLAFVRLAGELGLYVILRPGPYIGADWGFGGLPAWLTTKTGVVYRTGSAAYSHYLDKYFRQMLPRLAECQVSRGGNIVLIQNENRYDMTTMPDRLNHLEFISQLFRRSGFDIPIITCNRLSAPPLPDSIECVCGGRDIVGRLKRLRSRQDDAPAIAIELYTGRADAWGREHEAIGAHETARRAMELLGYGCQYNYFMYHGGTNLGFWASRMGDSQDSYGTTSYDYDAPLAEGGGLTEKYYLCRLPNLLARHMGRFLAACTAPAPGVTVQDATEAWTLLGPTGSWAFVSNGGRSDIETARISLPQGEELTVPLGLLGAAAVPFDLQLRPGKVLQSANLTPLGFFGDKTLVFHGPAGWEARLRVDGEELCANVPGGDEPKVIDFQDLQIVLITSELATRTFLAGDTLVFGASFVGETVEDLHHRPGAKQCALLSLGGKLTHKKAPAVRPKPPTAPKLKPWKRISVCTEPVSSDLEWQPMDRPCDADRLGIHEGYVWHRVQWSEPRARRRSLFLPDCEDRATVYLNGSLLGVWGRGEDASRLPMSAAVKRGPNVLTLLVDNLGRTDDGWRLGEPKGLFGPVYDAKALRIRKPKLRAEDRFPKRVIPRGLLHLLDPLERLPVWALDVDLPLPQVSPVHVSFADVAHHVAVLCNDRPAGFFPSNGRNFGDVTLTVGLQKGKNLLRFLLWGDVQPDVAEKFRFYGLLDVASHEGTWGYRTWEMPTAGGPVVGKNQPAWYASRFSHTPQGEPLFLHVAGAKKGQMILNGHNIGRFWTIGPQQYYYLPDCWLREDNELLVFVEQGDLPRRTRLEYRPLGPYR